MDIPHAKEFIYETPLYEEFEVSMENVNEAAAILYNGIQIDGYCPMCNSDSIFHTGHIKGFFDKISILNEFSRNGSYIERTLTCKRNDNHKIYCFLYIGKSLISTNNYYYMKKVGQIPSMADLVSMDFKKYKKVLNAQQSNEFRKGVGLASHGVGVGSFVYLRRVFEGLIEDAHVIAKETTGWDDNIYKRCRVTEKINLLKDYLPNILVKNYQMYGILSKGIHELTEEECKEYFPIMKTGIELILNQKIRIFEEAEAQKKVELEIAKIAGKIKS